MEWKSKRQAKDHKVETQILQRALLLYSHFSILFTLASAIPPNLLWPLPKHFPLAPVHTRNGGVKGAVKFSTAAQRSGNINKQTKINKFDKFKRKQTNKNFEKKTNKMNKFMKTNKL